MKWEITLNQTLSYPCAMRSKAAKETIKKLYMTKDGLAKTAFASKPEEKILKDGTYSTKNAGGIRRFHVTHPRIKITHNHYSS